MPQIQDYDPATLDFGVRYEDQSAGFHPEDHSELVAQVYYVSAVAPDGATFLRYVGTFGWVVEDEEFGPVCFRRVFHNARPLTGLSEEGLAEMAGDIANRLQTSTTRHLNPDAWVYAGSVYGSQAYQRYGDEEALAAEEREAEEWG